MKRFLLLVSMMGLIGCSGGYDGQTESLTKRDGVTLYRVWDGKSNHWVYFSTPDGDVQWRERVGKHDEDRKVQGVK